MLWEKIGQFIGVKVSNIGDLIAGDEIAAEARTKISQTDIRKLTRVLNEQEFGFLDSKSRFLEKLPPHRLRRIFAVLQIAAWQSPRMQAAIGMLAKEQLALFIKNNQPNRYLMPGADDPAGQSLHPEG